MIRTGDPEELRRAVDGWRRAGDRIGFVPTMGALHAGHLSLVAQARALAERVVASVYVNPAQFDRADDLAAYPRDPDRDAELLAGAGCDLVFLPTDDVLYPPGHATWVVPEGPAEGLEGAHRAGHFRGVATVVLKLINLVRPDLAVFGEKDAQQLAVVRRMARDLFVPVEIVAGATVREENGLALSSRNARLSPEERRAAQSLSRALARAQEAIRAGGPDGPPDDRVEAVRRLLADELAAEPLARVEYAEVVEAESFRPAERLAGELILPLAVWIGGTRLIDNVKIESGRTTPCDAPC